VSALRLRSHKAGRPNYDAERMGDFVRIGPTSIRQDGASGMTLEELHSEEIFELVDVVTNCGWRNP
jgi:hypothetical protein